MQHHYTCFADFPQIDELADIDLVLDGNGGHETENQHSPDSLAPDPAEAVAFVERHFRPGPDGHFGGHILLWTKSPVTGEKISTWFRTLPEFQDFVETQASNLSKLDVYVGMAVSSHNARKGKDLTRYNRLSEEAAASITSLWQDLDTTTGHAGDTGGKTYFKDLDALLAAVPALPLPPTELVCSGNGVQAYWRLAERLEIEPDRQSVVDLLKKWEEKVQRSLAPVTVDSVADLPRVLRLPGFLNNKQQDNPKPVFSLMSDGPTYTVAEIAALVPEGPPRRPTQARSRAKASNRGPAARSTVQTATAGMTDDDWTRHAVTCENDPGFATKWDAIWSRSRPDLANQSGSEYDLALANLVAREKWDYDAIHRTLVERRLVAQRAGWEEVKVKDPSYYQRTIGKASAAAEGNSKNGTDKKAGTEEERAQGEEDAKRKRPSRRKVAEGHGWQSGRDGIAQNSLPNAKRALRETGWADRLAFNEWTETLELDGKAKDIAKFEALMADSIEDKYWALGYNPVRGRLREAAEVTARRYNPVLERINAEEWDRTDRWGLLALHITREGPTVLNKEIAALLVRGIVVRALEPGCQFDYAIVIRSDKEGVGKQTLLKMLAVGGHSTGAAF